ncbi:MAG: DUF2974 domain-containing protein [Candidatus Accumulibacter sp.]|jgi:hypothetical protein|nr:DUF2974 domain-containing protein [Accumulibacter sp.]
MKQQMCALGSLTLCFAAFALFSPDAAALTPEERQKAQQFIRLGVEKAREKFGQVQQAARASVAEALGRQADCQAFGEAQDGRRDEFVLLASLSSAIYQRPEAQGKRQPGEPESRDVVAEGKNITLWFDPVSEGYAEVHHDALPDTEVIVFRGTQLRNLKDLSTNLSQFVNIVPERYQWAAHLAQRIAQDAPQARLLITGHSLGGGLAAYAALAHGVEAVAFNPAGLSRGALATLPAITPETGESQIVAFIARSGETLDPVSALSLAGESRMAGRRYLVERESGLTHLQIHNMEGFAQAMEDAAEALTRCETDLGFQGGLAPGKSLSLTAGDSRPQASAAVAENRPCRTMSVKTGKGETRQRYCRDENGEWTPEEDLPSESRAAPQATASAEPAEPPKMSRMANGKEVLVADADIAGKYKGGTILDNGILKAHGKGVAEGKDRYEGEFQYGFTNGKGTYAWADGSRYVGDWVRGERSGKGVGTWAKGERYEGGYLNGKAHGYGVSSHPKANKLDRAALLKEGKVQGQNGGSPVLDIVGNYLNVLRTEGDRMVVSGWWKNGELKYRCLTEKDEAACEHEDMMTNLKTAGKVAKDIWTLKPLKAAADKLPKSYIEDSGGNSAQACSRLYVGKAVTYRTCKTTLVLKRKKCDNHRGVITGMNANIGKATVMIRENYSHSDNGQLVNLSCSAIN